MVTLADRVRGAVLGHLVADALGVPYEFHRPSDLPSVVTMTPPRGFRRAHRGVPPGTWSDDGAQLLALLDSLLECGRLDPDDLGKRFVQWYFHGRYAVDGKVYDCGIQTSDALRQITRGTPAAEAGRTDERANGNGSLMRVLPLGLWHRGSDAELCADAHTQSRTTHGHRRSIVCCQVYCLWVRRLLAGGDPAAAFEDAVATFRAVATPTAVHEWDTHVLAPGTRPDDLAPNGSGYVVDSFHAAVRLNLIGDTGYEAVVRSAIALGDDTDTTACIAGGIAGLVHGVAAIPPGWLDALRDRPFADDLIDRLVTHLGESA